MLYFHDLPYAPEGMEIPTRPESLRDCLRRAAHLFVMDVEGPPQPPVDVVGFRVRGPQRTDAFGLLVRADLLDGSPEENGASIARTSPDGWEVSCRVGTV